MGANAERHHFTRGEVTMPILPIDSTIVSNPSRAHLSISRELEDQVDDSPCDDNELDGPENEEDEDSDPAEPSLGSVGTSTSAKNDGQRATAATSSKTTAKPASPIRTD